MPCVAVLMTDRAKGRGLRHRCMILRGFFGSDMSVLVLVSTDMPWAFLLLVGSVLDGELQYICDMRFPV
jgi:hypothetical protein